ncbi:MAG: hypothetical protein AAF330_07105 [Pseudomonadota bacterium]
MKQPGEISKLAAKLWSVFLGSLVETQAAVYLHFADRSSDGRASDQWRGFLPVAGRLVTVGLRAAETLSADLGETLIRDFAAEVLKANVETAVPTAPAWTAAADSTLAPEAGEVTPGFFSRIRQGLAEGWQRTVGGSA